MMWRVTFQRLRHNCCPPGQYWEVREITVDAESPETAIDQVRKIWKNHQIKIQDVAITDRA